MHLLSQHGDVVLVSVVLDVASQMSKLWRKDSGSTGKQKMYKCFCYNPDVTSCINGDTRIEIFV